MPYLDQSFPNLSHHASTLNTKYFTFVIVLDLKASLPCSVPLIFIIVPLNPHLVLEGRVSCYLGIRVRQVYKPMLGQQDNLTYLLMIKGLNKTVCKH